MSESGGCKSLGTTYASFCMVYKFFVEVGRNLADEIDSQGNDLLGLQ